MQFGRQHREQRAAAASRQNHAEHTAGARHQHGLREDLAAHAHAARAERGPDRDLLRPRRRPRKHKVGDIRASDQQHQPYRAQQHQQRGPRAPHQFLVQRRHIRSPARVRGRILRRQPLRDRADFGPCARRRHAALQPRDHHKRTRSADKLTRVRPDRHPEIGVSRGKLEPRAHHAGDCVPPALDRDRLPDHIPARPETPLPQSMAQHHRGTCRRRIVVANEGPAQQRLSAKQLEELPGDERHRDALRLHLPRHIHLGVLYGGHLLESPALLAPVQEVGIAHRRGRCFFRCGLPDHHQAGRLLVGQRAQQRRIYE